MKEWGAKYLFLTKETFGSNQQIERKRREEKYKGTKGQWIKYNKKKKKNIKKGKES